TSTYAPSPVIPLIPYCSYTFDDSNPPYHPTRRSSDLNVVANYTVTDEHGATSSSSLTITLTGTNDAPVALADTNSGLEDSTITRTVENTYNDESHLAILCYSLHAQVAGLTLNANGRYS